MIMFSFYVKIKIKTYHMFSFRPTNCSNQKKRQELKKKVSVLFEYICEDNKKEIQV